MSPTDRQPDFGTIFSRLADGRPTSTVEVDAAELAALRRDRERLRLVDRFWRRATGESLLDQVDAIGRSRRRLGRAEADRVEAAALARFDQDEAGRAEKPRPDGR